MSFTQNLDPVRALLERFVVTTAQATVAAWFITGGKLDKMTVFAAFMGGLSVGYNTVLKPAFRAFRDNVVKPWLVGRGLLQG